MNLCAACHKRPGTIYIGGYMDHAERYICHQCDYNRRYQAERDREDQRERERMTESQEFIVETDQGYVYARATSIEEVERWARESKRFSGLSILNVRESDCDPFCDHRKWELQT